MNSVKSTHCLRGAAIVLCTLLIAPALSAQAKPANARAPGAAAASPAASQAPAVSGVLNLNTASAEELTRLPGVGPSRAQAIVELRTRMKGFKSLEDLMKVRGIGRKTFRKLEPMLRLQGPTTLVETRKPGGGARAAAVH
jgi:competence protein ComEA